MPIPEQFIDELVARSEISDVVSSYVHLRGFGDLFLLELLFIRGCFNMGSVDKNHAWVYHPVVQCFVQNMCKNFFTQLRGKAFAKGITYRCKVRNLFQQAISEKPTVCYVYLYIPVRLT